MKINSVRDNRESMQIACDCLHWIGVGMKLKEAGLVEPIHKRADKSSDLMTECAALGIFPDTSETSCRHYLMGSGVKRDLDQLAYLYMNPDEAIEELKGIL